MIKKYKWIILGISLMSCILIVGLINNRTSAIPKKNQTKEQIVSVGDFKIDLIDTGKDETLTITENQKSNSIERKVQIRNKSNSPALIRVMALPSLVEKDGVLGSIDLKDIANLNLTNWAYGDDGYYYYLGSVASDDVTAELFSKIQLDPAKTSVRTDGANLKVYVKAEAITAEKGSGTKPVFWDAWQGDDEGTAARIALFEKLKTYTS